MSTGAILVICREPSDLTLVDRLKDGSVQSVVVASDRIDVQHSALRRPWVEKACFIEQMESFYVVASDVLQIRNAVNQWLSSLVEDREGFPEELLFFERHAEGGLTTQRIQDALLLIRSYRRLFRENRVHRVVIRRSVNHQWEDSVLIQTARSCSVEIEEHRSMGYRVVEKLGFHTTSRRFLRRYPVYVPRCLFYLVQPWFKLGMNVIQTKLNNRKILPGAGDGSEIAFLLGSSANKHVENIVPVMNEFQRREGITPVALCWQAADGAKKVRRAGLRADELEAWFPLLGFWGIVRCVRTLLRRAKSRQEELRSDHRLTYEGVALMPLLHPSIEHLLRFQMVRRMALKVAAETYFRKHSPVAMKAWGDNALELGIIVDDVVRKVSNARSLVFFYTMGTAMDSPYAEHNCDLYLAAGESEKHRLESKGVDSEKVVVVGQSRYDHLLSFRQRHSQRDSRGVLGLPSHGKLYAFYAPQRPIRGYLTWREHFVVAKVLVDLFDNSDLGVLIVKPHPSDSSRVFDVLKQQYESSPSVVWHSRKALPYHCINAADVVITKYSTVGLEAMLLSTPVISIALEGESRFQDVFGDVAERFTTLESMVSFLRSIALNPAERAVWEDKQRQLRQRFLTRRLAHVEGGAARPMADAILNRLEI